MQRVFSFQRRARSLRSAALALLAGVLASACATPFGGQLSQVVGETTTQHLEPGHGVIACRQALRAAQPPAVGAELDAGHIRLVNWNVRKTSLPGWRADYDRVARDRDLVLLQEAALRPDTHYSYPGCALLVVRAGLSQ
ncbi:MAG: hypothetical protein U5K76_01055 [Woeseiaceae bacterium]|nr:hypothetical protein [Woeseiaceae bacterium]